jgi:hypothetical protein
MTLPYERLKPGGFVRALKVLPTAEESMGSGSSPCLDSQPLLFVFLVSFSSCLFFPWFFSQYEF